MEHGRSHAAPELLDGRGQGLGPEHEERPDTVTRRLEKGQPAAAQAASPKPRVETAVELAELGGGAVEQRRTHPADGLDRRCPRRFGSTATPRSSSATPKNSP